MRICEVLGSNTNDMIEVQNIIMFLKSKGISEIPVKAVMRELYKRGFQFSKDEIEPIISNMQIVSSVTNGNIVLNGIDVKDSEAEIEDDATPDRDDDFDMDEERVKQMARSSRLRRDR